MTGPGSLGRVGKGVLAQACSMSLLLRPAGKCAFEAGAGGCGTTSEQSMSWASSWPSRVILRKAALNADWSLAWLSGGGRGRCIRTSGGRGVGVAGDGYSLTKDCHSQAVRESRASSESDWRRISPWSGDSTSPWLPPVPGKSVPRSWVSMKNWVSKISGVESKGVPGIDSSTWSAAATVWLFVTLSILSSASSMVDGHLRSEEGNDFLRGESACVFETLENTVDSVKRLWNSQVRGGLSGIDTAEEDVKTRSTRAVAEANGTSKLNAIKEVSRA